MQRPYFESVRDVYYRAACEMWKLAAAADPETADPESFLARGNMLWREALETWPTTTRQDNTAYRLQQRAKANTREGRAHAQAVRESLGV